MNKIGRVLVAIMLVAGVASAQAPLSDADVAGLIAQVRNVPASKLDSSLSSVPFEEWLIREIPKGAVVGWAAREAATGTPKDVAQSMPWVEADVSMQGRPLFVMMVACGVSADGDCTKPKIYSIAIFERRNIVDVARLRDLPASLRQ